MIKQPGFHIKGVTVETFSAGREMSAGVLTPSILSIFYILSGGNF